MNTKLILAIDTATDETSAAVTEGTKVLSNVVWSQASLHAKWGGVVPSLAQRQHEERIDFVIDRAILNAKCQMQNLDAIAVTTGPGLAIALGVGIDRAKKLAKKFHKPLFPVNHIEGHVLSPFANPKSKILNLKSQGIKFPALGLVVSGGNTQLILIEKIGKYRILAETRDDALGEALDKAGRMLGLGYPAGPIVERLAREGSPKKYSLPIPVVGREKEQFFSYSGLKTSMYRLVEKMKTENGELSKKDICDLCATFQDVSFKHLERVTSFTISHLPFAISHLLVGGGVAANTELRKRLRKIGKINNLKVRFPYSKKLCTDNAGMIGVAAFFKAERGEFVKDVKFVDRDPSAKIGGIGANFQTK